MNYKILIAIIIFLFLIPFAKSEYVLKGNYYECTSNCSSFDAGDYGIWIKGDVNVVGENGETVSGCSTSGVYGGNPGSEGSFELNSTSTIRISSNITVEGGDGSDGYYCYTRNGYSTRREDDGGIGGDGNIIVNASRIIVDDGVILSSTGGVGGNGDSTWTVSCKDDGNYYYRTYSGCQCYEDDWCENDDDVDCDCEDASGGAGGASRIELNSDVLNLYDSAQFILNGGAGGEADSEIGAGGAGGLSRLDLNGDVLTANGTLDIDITSGTGQDSEGGYDRETGDYCDDDDFDADGGAGGLAQFYIDSSDVNISNIDLLITGGNSGGPGGYEYAKGCTAYPVCGNERGGVAGGVYVSLSASGVIDVLNVTGCGGQGGSGSTWGDSGGNGGTSSFYLYGDLNVSEGVWDFNSGVNCAEGGNGEEDGGAGGSLYSYFDGNIRLSNVSLANYAGGQGEDTYTGSSYHSSSCRGETGGNGGNSMVVAYDNLTLSNCDFSSILGGKAGATGLYGVNPYSGYGKFIMAGTRLITNNTKISGTGADGSVSAVNSDDAIPGEGRIDINVSDYVSAHNFNYSVESGAYARLYTQSIPSYLYIEGSDVYLEGSNSNLLGTGVGDQSSFIKITSDRRILLGENVTIDHSDGAEFSGGHTQDFYFMGSNSILGLFNTYIPDQTYVYSDNDDDCVQVARSGREDQNLVFDDCSSEISYYTALVDLENVTKTPNSGVNSNETTDVVIGCSGIADIWRPATGIKANFTWFKNDAIFVSSNEINVSDDIWFNSEINISAENTSIDDVFYCEITAYGDNYSQSLSSHNATIIPTYPSGFKIDVGNDGVYEYEGSGKLESSVSIEISNLSSFNEYLRDCTAVSSNCTVPITLVSDTNATVNLSNLVITYGVGNAQTQDENLNFSWYSDTSGDISFSSVSFEYDDIKEIKITARTNDTRYYNTNSTSHYISVAKSLFSINDMTDYEEPIFYPTSLTDTNVQPLGGNPFWNISTESTTDTCYPIDLYIMLNDSTAYESVASCIDINVETNYTSNNINNGSLTAFKIYENASCNNSEIPLNISIDLDCLSGTGVYYNPTYLFDSLCSECVKASDWDDKT